MTLVIKNWNEKYETAESRRNKANKWLPLPNKMDGLVYRRISKQKNCHEIFSCWILLLQLASKMPTRGTLEETTGALTYEDMEDMTGFPAQSFKRAVDFLKSPKINWIEDNEVTQQNAGHAQQSSGHTTTTLHNNTIQNNTIQNNTEHKVLFDEARSSFPGSKRGLDTEFEYFRKSHKDWKTEISKLLPAIQNEIAYKTALKAGGHFCPEWKALKTWIYNRCWEQEFPVISVQKMTPEELAAEIIQEATNESR